MRSLRYFFAPLLALTIACATTIPALASILIQIDKPTQRMAVSVDGQVRYRWPVSTGATWYSTPTGSYAAFRMELMHYSQEWDNAGMPHSIFFTKGVTPFMARTILVLAALPPTVVYDFACRMPQRSMIWSKPTA